MGASVNSSNFTKWIVSSYFLNGSSDLVLMCMFFFSIFAAPLLCATFPLLLKRPAILQLFQLMLWFSPLPIWKETIRPFLVGELEVFLCVTTCYILSLVGLFRKWRSDWGFFFPIEEPQTIVGDIIDGCEQMLLCNVFFSSNHMIILIFSGLTFPVSQCSFFFFSTIRFSFS